MDPATLLRAQQALNESRWSEALYLFGLISQQTDPPAQVLHNLALSQFAMGAHQDAAKNAQRALEKSPSLWQSAHVMGRAFQALGDPEKADLCFDHVLKISADRSEALLAKADLAINVFGMPLEGAALVSPLLSSPAHAADAELTILMASLYDRDSSAEVLAQNLMEFSAAHLRLQRGVFAPRAFRAGVEEGRTRPRVGVISPLLCASPVHFLTIDRWRQLAKTSDLVVFNRGHKQDWATHTFQSLAHEWHPVQEMPADDLAQYLFDADLDVLYDLGGWMDSAALKALSSKPARRMYKWVGGQSATTGLEVFDGWIGDHWQSPVRYQKYYSEPLINIPGGYANYTPPTYFPKVLKNMQRRKDVVIFSNPAKISRRFLMALSKLSSKKVFLHQNFRFPRTRKRIEQALGSHELEFITPGSHEEALRALSEFGTMVDTFPYSSGLTAREALALGLTIKTRPGVLFCERHSAHAASS